MHGEPTSVKITEKKKKQAPQGKVDWSQELED